jgi:hypothetical protein
MRCNYNNFCNKPIFSKSLCLCCNHLILTHNNNILNIQKTFRGYKTRKKIKNIYIKLPSDIQNIILYYINLPIYYLNYYKKIRNIVNKKTKELLYYDYTSDNKLSIDYISKCFYYINKYCRVMNINEIKILFVLNDDLRCIVNNYIYNYINHQVDISIWNNNVLTEIINFENNSFDKMIVLYNRINNFNDIYNYYYSITQNKSIM